MRDKVSLQREEAQLWLSPAALATGLFSSPSTVNEGQLCRAVASCDLLKQKQKLKLEVLLKEVLTKIFP